jgi:apolipoprotein N-acyltransferase
VARAALLIFAAVLLAMSWLDERLFISAWAGLILFFAAVPAKSARRGWFAGALFGAVSLAIAFHWAPRMLSYTFDAELWSAKPIVSFAVLVLWESIPYGFLGMTAALAKARRVPLWIVPVSWIAIEFFWPKVFPSSLGHTQTGFPPILQIAELGGVAAVSFVMIYVCADLGRSIAERDFAWRWRTAAPLLLLVAALMFGAVRMRSLDRIAANAKTLRVGVVQVDPSYNESPQKMRKASEPLAASVDLLVWPESTLGTYSTQLAGLADVKRDINIVREPFIQDQFARGLKVPLLVGGRSFEPGAAEDGPYLQTAFLVDSSGRFAERYQKRVLLPIGEYVPYEQSWPWLHEWAQLGEYFVVGTSDDPISMADGEMLGVLMCYEDAIADAPRRSVVHGAELLISLINDSAFDTDLALEQHRRLATLRAVENRRTLIRCAGTGVSCVIDPTGRVVTRLPLNQDGQFTAAVPLLDSRTLYNRAGYLLPHASGIIAIVWLLPQVKRTRPIASHQKHPEPES